MDNRINELQGWILVGVSCLLAGSLAVNAARALFGIGEIAWWQYPLMAFMYCLTRESLTRAQEAVIARTLRNARKRAALSARQTYLHIRRAVRGLAALFILPSSHRPQTEP